MRLVTKDGRELWLAYGMNVHAGGSVDVMESAVASTVLPLRERLGASGPFGIALRFDAPGVKALLEDDARRASFHALLAKNDLVPFTGNAFVAGDFHASGVKQDVYRPTWHERERVEYTLDFAEVMAQLASPGSVVSLSTSPGSFKLFDEGPRVVQEIAHGLVYVAHRLRTLEETTGVRVLLGLEPEPFGTFETTEEIISFFRGPLKEGFGRDRAAMHHLGVCYDVCHQAVEGEDAAEGLARLEAAGVPLVKLQASSALELPDPSDAAGRAALARFVEPRWLHQVMCETAAGERLRAVDLPDALSGTDAAKWISNGRPWRIHFHVPVHREDAVPPLRTTRHVLEGALLHVAAHPTTSHVEIETYTWDALPAEHRGDGLVESLAREYEWVLSVLARGGIRRAS